MISVEGTVRNNSYGSLKKNSLGNGNMMSNLKKISEKGLFHNIKEIKPIRDKVKQKTKMNR